MRHQRYVVVPWLYIKQTDLEPQGEPEAVVTLPNGEELEGLHIRGLETDMMLGVRMVNGHPHSCAITHDIQLDIPMQSNPRRVAEPGEDA